MKIVGSVDAVCDLGDQEVSGLIHAVTFSKLIIELKYRCGESSRQLV